MKTEQQDRAKVLLKAALDLLTECDNAYWVLDAMDVLVTYDGTQCDGSCLKDDIDELLTEMNKP